MRFPARRAVLTGLGLSLLAACAKKAETASAWERIKASGVLRIALEGTYPPFNFQGKDGQLTGFEVDFAKALAAQLGLKPKFQTAPFAGLLGALESGRADVVINQITITPEREAKYDFSEPYTISGVQIIKLKDRPGLEKPEDLAGKKVGVGLGTNYEQWARANVPSADIRTYDDDFVKTSPEFVASGAPFAAQGAGVAMKKDPGLKVVIDQAIDALRSSGKLSAISQKWFGLDVTH